MYFKFLLIIALGMFVLTIEGFGQSIKKALVQPIKWENIKYHAVEHVALTDTCFIMVSNRHIDAKKLNFADEFSDTTQTHILFVTKRDSIWHIYELETLEQACSMMPSRDWVLYAEGMGKLFTGNLQRGNLMQAMYQVNVILFDYASINSQLGLLKNFKFSLHNAEKSAHQYYHFLCEVKKIQQQTTFFKHKHLSIFLHSMGNILLKNMMLAKYFDTHQMPIVDNLILNAACINRKNHHAWLAHPEFAKRVFVHFNQADNKLFGAMLLSGNRKLGSKPIRPFATGVNYINFHAVVGKTHNYFLNIPERTFRLSPLLYNYLSTILHGNSIALPIKFY